MIGISVLALAANGISLYILEKAKSNEAHIRASMICTSNDVIMNLGVIVGGILVFLLDSAIPDLVVGVVVFGIVIRGALRILKLAK
jgi:Co/Zn/Cd efflux system component